MNWSLLTTLLTTTLIAILGWIVVHRLNMVRDRASRHRDLRTQFLIDAYRALENFAGRRPPYDRGHVQDFERAIADIQLFGNKQQVERLKGIFDEKRRTGDADLNRIVNELRTELRAELGLPLLHDKVTWLRIDEKLKKSV